MEGNGLFSYIFLFKLVEVLRRSVMVVLMFFVIVFIVVSMCVVMIIVLVEREKDVVGIC